jgi:hypothetical protein
MVWCLSSWLYDKAPEAVRKTTLLSILAWFCLDSAGSTLSGNVSNVVFNVVVLLIAVGPMWLPVSDNSFKTE